MIDLPQPLMQQVRDGCRDEAFERQARIIEACQCMGDLNDAMRNRDVVYGLNRTERRQDLAALIGAKFRAISKLQPATQPVAMRAEAHPPNGPMDTGT